MTAVSREFRSKSQPRRGMRRIDAAAFVGVSPTKFDDWVERGLMPKPKTIDGVVLWDLERLDRAWDELPDGAHEGAGEDHPWS
jgi:predicted DNA-binding transcriptional regulator AlpA